jgi:hypothetical protein
MKPAVVIKGEMLLKRRLRGVFKTDLDQAFRIPTQASSYSMLMSWICHDFNTIVLEDCSTPHDRDVRQRGMELPDQYGLVPLLRVMSSKEILRETTQRSALSKFEESI